jgi:hypothetical protein
MDDDEIAIFVLIALAGLFLLGWGARSRPWEQDDPPEDAEEEEDDEDPPW